ncbi:hypothetical protein B4N89_45515 [Embleya scabrispora]|uniref:Fido domain-containing protein n=1 Tax=Embleya scabrispora TaxID=159449 RepID=A0A1T3NJ43_9ACTN|nr:Fic family protein [Embleya scabrispora]OPC76745.1 hypothetical protein B4N89_45515 [Embleya scabrispora]
MRGLDDDALVGVNRLAGGTGTVRHPALLGAVQASVYGRMSGRDLYPGLADRAAALTHGIMRVHPFVDANERTAILAMVYLCRINGYRLVWASPRDAVALIRAVNTGQPPVEWISRRIASRLQPLHPPPTNR